MSSGASTCSAIRARLGSPLFESSRRKKLKACFARRIRSEGRVGTWIAFGLGVRDRVGLQRSRSLTLSGCTGVRSAVLRERSGKVIMGVLPVIGPFTSINNI